MSNDEEEEYLTEEQLEEFISKARGSVLRLEDGNFLVFEDKKYTPREMEELTDAYLRSHVRAINPETGKRNGLNGILFEEHMKYRKRREIYTQNGVADPTITAILVERWKNTN